MHIGALKIVLHIPSSQSLKAKRSVIKPLYEKLRQRNNVSVSEVEFQDQWQKAAIGVVTVNSDAKQARAMLDQLLDYVKEQQGNFVIMDHQIEVLDFG